jgi:hypothetical protein
MSSQKNDVRISKGQGAGPEKGLFSALLDFQKRHFLGTL